MNGWFYRCAAALTFTLTQHFPRCERTQQENRIHTMGSNQPLAAICTEVCYATFRSFAVFVPDSAIIGAAVFDLVLCIHTQLRRIERLSQISSWDLKRLALVALPVLSALWLAVGIGVIGALSTGYSHLSQFMSALGASGAPFANWTNYAVFIPAELWLLLFFGLLAVHLPHSKSKWFSTAVLSAYAILLILLAILPCDAGCHGESDSNSSATSVHILHMAIAAIAYPIAFIGMLPLSLTAPSNTFLRRFALPVTAIGVGLIGAIVLVPHAQGLFQRLIEALIYVQLILMGWYAPSFPNSVER